MISFEPSDSRSLFERALQFGEAQVRRLLANHPDFYPMYTHEGRWKHDPAPRGRTGATGFCPA